MGLFSHLFPRHTLTPEPRNATTHDIQLARARVAAADPDTARDNDPEAFENWSNGLLRPWALTKAFTVHGFHGPWVDEALGVEEPIVDHMEAGLIYPGWGTLVTIAALVDTTPGTLISNPGTGPRTRTHHGSFIAGALRHHYATPIVDYTINTTPNIPEADRNLEWREAVAAATEEATRPIITALRNTNPDWADLPDQEIRAMVR